MIINGDWKHNCQRQTGVSCIWLVSTYVVCERLSVMHEPAGVVEILVQNPQNTPYSEVQFQNTPPKWKLSQSPYPRVSEYPPSKMKIVRESKSESFRIPPQNENCHRVQIWEFQNTPTPMKIVTESKSESFRIPPQNENCHRVQIWEFQNTPPWKLSQSPNPRVSE